MKRREQTVICIVFVFLAAARVAQLRGWVEPVAPLARLLDTLADDGLNKEGREALTAGYYEGLINEGSRVGAMNRMVTDNRRLTFENRAAPDRVQVNSFLFYELAPNMDQPDYDDDRRRYRLKTNSFGMADREYPVEKPAGTRRVALLGDSISRGQGAPPDGNYEALLEKRLNEQLAAEGGSAAAFEILNFSVGSYNITQMMDVALEKAPRFQPDVYVIGLTHLSVYRRWGQHIALLMHGGIDLKYDYLKNLAREAGLDPSEPIGVFDAKLARFRLPTLKWALGQVEAHASRHNARVLVLLLPTVDRSEVVQDAFLGVRETLRDLGIPYVDLLDAFDGDADMEQFAVAERDRHPNALGHARLADLLYDRLRSDPEAWAKVTGTRREQKIERDRSTPGGKPR